MILLSSGFIVIFLVVTFSQNIKTGLSHISSKEDILFEFFILIVNYSYDRWIFWIIPRLNIDKGDTGLIDEKHTATYESFMIFTFIMKLGYMMQGDGIKWNYFCYLIYYMATSINIQTNLITNSFFKLTQFIKRKCFDHTIIELQPSERCRSLKLAAGRKFIFTILIFVKMISMHDGQWLQYYGDNTDGCYLKIPVNISSQLSTIKVVMFLLIDITVDIFCYFYNKSKNFQDIIYYIPIKSYIIHGLFLYYTIIIFEVLLQKILMLS